MTGRNLGSLRGALLVGGSLLALSACVRDNSFDADLRGYGKGIFSTSDAALQASADRPTADARGIISYPGYQVAVARQGDTVDSVAARVGLPASELAQYNALQPGVLLRQGEVLTLPRRVADAAALPPATAGGFGAAPAGAAGASGGGIDVTTLASGAIDRATAGKPATQTASAAPAPTKTVVQTGAEPARHKVERGETAYTIARMYNVNVKALADWNGLGSDLSVREGQILLIPVGAGGAVAAAPTTESVTLPGEQSPTPPPPSAKKPLPKEKTVAAATPVKPPPAPDLGTTTAAKLSMPVQGKIIRGYQKKKNDGIDISAAGGTTVEAAGDGTVAAITKNTNGVPILVIRHTGNLLTVYANLDSITVKKGDQVRRGQPIATVRASDPAFLHFEVRQGMDSVDPMPYLQ
ncbi:MAG: peptidoglycan DD-metalloendopeptidase family protein [Proteobacteria bacterium]|nr:peptidoglycan DD-metalloendopeptidase family protein [Pseudomonadota bacterium]